MQLNLWKERMSVIAKYLISLLLLFNVTGITWGEVDSAMNVIRSLPCDTMRLNELRKCSQQRIDTPDELVFLDTLLNESIRQGNIDYQVFAYRNRVRHYFNRNKLKEAQLVAEPAVRFLRKHKKYAQLFDVKSMLINMYTNCKQYEISIREGHDMYDEAELLNDSRGKISACYVLGYACYVSKRYTEAIFWCRHGIDLSLKLSDEPMMEVAEFYFMIAESFYGLEEMDSMKLYVDSVNKTLSVYAKKHSKELTEHCPYYLLWMYCRYATDRMHFNDPEKALSFLEKASALMDRYKYDIYKDLYYYIWSDYYLAVGELDQAMKSLEKAREYELGWLQSGESPKYLKKRAVIYYAMEDYQAAADEIQRSSHLADSLAGVRFMDQSRQLRSIYDMNRLEAESKKQLFIIQIQVVLVVSLCIAVLLLFYYLFRFYRMKKELAVAVEKACQEDEKTSGFLQNMGKEVQVFLKDISDLSDALIREPETVKKQEYATQICCRNERAQRVIFDILDVSKIESDRMQFQYEEISLNGLVEEVCSTVLQDIPNKVTIRLQPCEEILFSTDPMRLNRALFNLLHYAVTHTYGGCICVQYENRGNEVCFTISGENWSMSEDEYRSLFDRLAQTSGRLEDMRLEMLISHGLIVKMGGALTVSPSPAGGTRFEFVLPNNPLLIIDNRM